MKAELVRLSLLSLLVFGILLTWYVTDDRYELVDLDNAIGRIDKRTGDVWVFGINDYFKASAADFDSIEGSFRWARSSSVSGGDSVATGYSNELIEALRK